MRSLTLRFFLAFWLIIVTLAGLAAIGGYAYSERMREAYENFESGDTIVEASAILEADGRNGLQRWLRDLPGDAPFDVYIVDDAGRDLLDRRVPPWADRLMRRFESRRRRWHPPDRDPPNLRAARPLTRLRGPDGAIYTLFVDRKRNPYGEWIGGRAGPTFLFLAILLSGAVSFALARAISRPVRSLRTAALAIAEGRLDTRVDPATRKRRDEIGLLASDLDTMASRLEQASDRQRELTRNVSHELRSPLARLRVALELARREAGELPEFRRIDAETERLDDMIGQLLRYARLEADEDSKPEAIDVSELLAQVVDDANFECRSAGLEGVSVALLRNDPCTVNARPQALLSAFENVLRNAIRHSPPHSEVTVQSRRAGGEMVVTVEDRGEGVSDPDTDKIFEPFYRAAGAMASGAQGSGLGLAIAARAVASSGGHIRADNVEGGGLQMTIRLPITG